MGGRRWVGDLIGTRWIVILGFASLPFSRVLWVSLSESSFLR